MCKHSSYDEPLLRNAPYFLLMGARYAIWMLIEFIQQSGHPTINRIFTYGIEWLSRKFDSVLDQLNSVAMEINRWKSTRNQLNGIDGENIKILQTTRDNDSNNWIDCLSLQLLEIINKTIIRLIEVAYRSIEIGVNNKRNFFRICDPVSMHWRRIYIEIQSFPLSTDVRQPSQYPCIFNQINRSSRATWTTNKILIILDYQQSNVQGYSSA